MVAPGIMATDIENLTASDTRVSLDSTVYVTSPGVFTIRSATVSLRGTEVPYTSLVSIEALPENRLAPNCETPRPPSVCWTTGAGAFMEDRRTATAENFCRLERFHTYKHK